LLRVRPIDAFNRSLLLQLNAIYLPIHKLIFKTVPLDFAEFLSCLTLSGAVMFAVKIEKRLVRREMLYGTG
jgi:hypothetical protein